MSIGSVYAAGCGDNQVGGQRLCRGLCRRTGRCAQLYAGGCVDEKVGG